MWLHLAGKKSSTVTLRYITDISDVTSELMETMTFEELQAGFMLP